MLSMLCAHLVGLHTKDQKQLTTLAKTLQALEMIGCWEAHSLHHVPLLPFKLKRRHPKSSVLLLRLAKLLLQLSLQILQALQVALQIHQLILWLPQPRSSSVGCYTTWLEAIASRLENPKTHHGAQLGGLLRTEHRASTVRDGF